MPWAHLIMKVNSLSHIFNVATTVTLMDVPCLWASLVTQTVKNLPAKQETWVQSIFTRLFCFIVLCNVMFFSVVMYGCELDYKKAECQRIDAFELWCWRRLLRVPWTARRSNQSILKEISPEYSLEGLMLKPNFNTLAT